MYNVYIFLLLGKEIGMLKSNQSSKRNSGSAAVLKGKCGIINIYIEDNESSWTFEQKTRTFENMSLAIYFIKEAACKYGMDLEISRVEFGYDRAIKYNGIVPTDMFDDPVWTEDVIKSLGYFSSFTAVESLRQRYAVEQVVLVYHINKQGTSYNLSFYKDTSPQWYAERNVIFTRYNSGNPTASGTFVHEILHSFGAGELYFPYDTTDERKQLAQKYFPNDIMSRIDYDISKLDIGRYTAYRIGWIDKLDELYCVFEDEG